MAVVPLGDRLGVPSGQTVATKPSRCSLTTRFMSSVRIPIAASKRNDWCAEYCIALDEVSRAWNLPQITRERLCCPSEPGDLAVIKGGYAVATIPPLRATNPALR